MYVPLLAQRILRHNRRVERAAAAPSDGGEPTGSATGNSQAGSVAEAGAAGQDQAQAGGRALRRQEQVLSGAPAAASAAAVVAHDRHHGRVIRLVGYAVGNGVTDDEVDGNSMVSHPSD